MISYLIDQENVTPDCGDRHILETHIFQQKIPY